MKDYCIKKLKLSEREARFWKDSTLEGFLERNLLWPTRTNKEFLQCSKHYYEKEKLKR